MNRNLVKKVIEGGGSITPLLVPSSETNGTGLMNPSIYTDKNNQLVLNLRHVNYTLYHSENGQVFQNRWGPLAYLNPENDIKLRTNNFFCVLDSDFSVKNHWKVDTSKLDVEPVWEFIGLEDARLVRWDDRLFMCGVRRDTKTNGEGRMELSEIVVNKTFVKERSRNRIEPPNDPNSYCEKNWMPILDLPYHFVKWTNPTEVVKVDLTTNTSSTVYQSKTFVPDMPELRGSSQVITYKGYRLCVVHGLNFFKNRQGQKDAKYYHHFVIWDMDWNIIKISEAFSFMGGEIEFCCGMTQYNSDLLITFGFQDNAAYVLKVPNHMIDDIIGLDKQNDVIREKWKSTKFPVLEITTSIPIKGCLVDCVFCPQRTLTSSYNGEKSLTLDNFKKLMDKVPREITITFAGFTEPWLNRECTDMVLYARDKGHNVSVFTTGIGMDVDDVMRLKDVVYSSGPNSGFALHIPDNEGYSKHPITDKYLMVLETFKKVKDNIPNFYVVCMGTVHDRVKHIFSEAYVQEMWSRAGNLNKEEFLKPELFQLKNKYRSIDNGNRQMTCGCVEKLYHNVLLPNGDVSLCCMDYGMEHIIGNLYDQEYNDIIPKLNSSFGICRYCENGINIK